LAPGQVGEYSGARKDVAPVTIATYQVLVTRRKGVHPHLALLGREDWGLIVYDEVHLLPAPVFRMTAEIQARRRLGLTATLVREDGREADVFTLIGPTRYDAPWPDLDAPVVTGQTPVREREQRFAAFRSGELARLVVSKVANFSIDLPEANVAIQVSGTFGSRQEEAQRLGRILRPKADGGRARFYTVVSRDTNDTEYAQRRQRFLAEQGYAYRLVDAGQLLEGAVPDLAGPATPARPPRRLRLI